MFEQSTCKSKALALAVVALFAMTAFCVLPAGSDATSPSEYGEGPYTINLFEGTTFTYQPGVNITDIGTTVFTVSDPNGIPNLTTGQNTSNLKITFNAPDTETTYEPITIQSTWTYGDLTQSVQQKIIFKTYLKPHFEADGESFKNLFVPVSDEIERNAVVKTISLVGTGASVDSVVIKDSAGQDSTDLVAEISTQNKTVTIKSNADELQKGSSYRIQINTTATVGQTDIRDGVNYQRPATQSASCTVDVNVGGSVALGPSSFTAYYNEDEDLTDDVKSVVKQITYTPLGVTNPVITISGSTDTDVVRNGVLTDGRFAIYTQAPVNSAASKEVTFTATLTGTYLGEEISESLNVTVKLYASAAFVTEPNAENMNTYKDPENPKKTIVSIDTEGALWAEINWGDGRVERVNTNNLEGTIEALEHSYEKEGLYQITITVYNEAGSESISMGYNTISGVPTTEPLAKVGHKEVTVNGEQMVQLSAEDSVNAVEYTWYNAKDRNTPLGHGTTLNVSKEDWEKESYVLVVTNELGDSNTYKFNKSTIDDKPTTVAEQEASWLKQHDSQIAIGAIIIALLGAAAVFYYGVVTTPTVVGTVIAALVALVTGLSALGILGL